MALHIRPDGSRHRDAVGEDGAQGRNGTRAPQCLYVGPVSKRADYGDQHRGLLQLGAESKKKNFDCRGLRSALA